MHWHWTLCVHFRAGHEDRPGNTIGSQWRSGRLALLQGITCVDIDSGAVSPVTNTSRLSIEIRTGHSLCAKRKMADTSDRMSDSGRYPAVVPALVKLGGRPGARASSRQSIRPRLEGGACWCRRRSHAMTWLQGAKMPHAKLNVDEPANGARPGSNLTLFRERVEE
jgi:hypothetical protein